MADNTNGSQDTNPFAKYKTTATPTTPNAKTTPSTPAPSENPFAKYKTTPVAPATPDVKTWLPNVIKGTQAQIDANKKAQDLAAKKSLSSVLGFASSVINTVETPLYFIEGVLNQNAKNTTNYVKELSTNPKAMGKFDIGELLKAGADNAFAWQSGKQTATGSEIVKSYNAPIDQNSPLGFITGLGLDIILDPLTHGLGKVASTAVKSAVEGGKGALTAGKMAAIGEKTIDGERLYQQTQKFAQYINKTETPVSTTITNFNKGKQAIPYSLQTQYPDLIKNLNTKIADNLAYRAGTTDTRSALATVASMAEAAIKGARIRWMTEFTKNDLMNLARQEAKTAKKASKKPDYVYEGAPLPENTTTVVAEVAPKITIEGVTKDIQPFEPHSVKGKGTYVYDGKNMHNFKTKKEATAWVKDTTKKEPIKTTMGERPIVDTKPIANPKAINLPSSSAEAKTIQKNIIAAEKLATEIKGIAASGNISEKVTNILKNAQKGSEVSTLASKATITRLKAAISGKENPLYVLNALYSMGGAEKTVATQLMGKTVVDKLGKTYKVAQAVKDNINKNIWEKIAPEQKAQIVQHLKDFLATTTTTADSTATLKELTAIVGKAQAKAILDTNILNGARGATTALKKILDTLPNSAEKTYASVTDLVDGIRAGDVIDYSAMEKILNYLDPEFKTIQSTAKAAGEKLPYEQLKNILVTKGPQTIFETQKRLDLMNSKTLMKAQGLGFSDIAASYAEGRLNGAAKLDKATMLERQAASANVASWANSPVPEVRAMYKDALDAVQLGIESNLKYYEEIAGSPNVLEGLTAFGDLAARNTEKAYQANTKSILLKQINQSGEAKIMGWMFGRMNARKLTPEARLKEAILKTEMVQNILLSVLGARTTYSKFVGGAEKATDKHYIFFDLGSTLKLLQQAGKDELAIKAFIPAAGKTVETKYNSLSFVGVSKAIRKVIEADEKNVVPNMEEIIADITSRAEMEHPWSPAYTKQVPKIAAELADAITDPAFVQAVKGIHNLRAAAAIEDNIASAETLAEDLFRSLIGGRVAALNTNIDSVATRNQQVRDWFNKFVYASGIFEQQSGQVAQSVFQAAAQIFMRNGKLKALANEEAMSLVGSATSRDAASRQIFADAVESINSFFKTTNSDAYAGAGRERLPFPTTASIAKAQDKLTEAETNYATHINEGKTLTSKAQVIAWEKKFNTLQTKLDAARQEAWNNNIPTRHWSNGDWVSSGQYDYKLAVSTARKNAEDTVMTEQGLMPKSAVDTPSKYSSHVKLNAAQTKKWLTQWRKDNNVRVTDMHAGLVEEETQKIVNNIPAYEALPLEDAELAQHLVQEQIAKPLDDANIEINANVMLDTTNYSVPRNLEENQVQRTRTEQMRQRHSATSGRANLQPLLVHGETSLKVNMAKIADVAHHLRSKYVRALGHLPLTDRADLFSKAFRYAMANMDVPATEEKIVQQMSGDIRAMISTTFGNPETTALTISGLDPEALAKAFGKFGLSIKNGMPSVSTMNPKEISNLLQYMPFAEMPTAMKGTVEGELWAKRAADFSQSGEDPFLVLTRLMSAVQFAKHERAIVNDFHTRFGWQNFFNTAEEATAAGWVKPTGITANGMDFTAMLPEVAQGGLYDPYIAKEFFSVNREWNAIFHEEGMSKAVQFMMNWAGFFKETQTILNLRHHITNAFGDTSIEVLNGTTNPDHWTNAFKMSMRYATEDFRSQWGANKFDTKIKHLFNLNKNFNRTIGEETATKPPVITINKNGKTTTQTLNLEDLLAAFEERGIAISNIFSNDIMGLQESVLQNVVRPDAQKTLGQQVVAKIKLGREKITKVPGTAAAWYGNVPRIAGALRIIEERSWKSLDDALDAATAEVNRLHPTIQSLASGERKTTRIAITYYTWLRVAHNVFIDMAINHTGALMVPSKLQFNVAQANGMAPTSIGRPWSQKLTEMLPSYLTNSPYGPMWNDAQGKPVLIKPSWLPLDVLSTWTFAYDPAYSTGDNAARNILEGGKIIGASSNVAVQPLLDVIAGENLQTHQAIPKTAQGLIDVGLSNFGQIALAKALTDYTPAGKTLTPEDRARTLRNQIAGLRETAVINDKNLQNATKEKNARLKNIIAELNKGKK